MWQIIYRRQKRIGTWLYMRTISNTWKYKFLITEFEIRTVTPGPNYFRGPEWVRLINGDPVPDPSNFRWLYVNVARTIAICGDVELQSLQQLSTNTIGHSQFFILIVKEWNSLPLNLRLIDSSSKFKSALKSCLYSQENFISVIILFFIIFLLFHHTFVKTVS